LLGPLEVRAGDGPLPLGGPKQRALLALLVLHANRVVSRERLIDELWGEEPPETAVKAVQVYVSQLRKLLPTATLMTQSAGYVLEVAPEAVDLLRFERLVADARSADAGLAAGLLRDALALWRGAALEDLDEPFAQAERGRLEALRLAALEERIEADLALGRHADVASELEALIADHPHRERLRGQLMLALYRSGRQADALEAYRGARAALNELGLEPGPPLRQLEKRILTHDSALDRPRERLLPGAVPLPGPLVPASPFPFAGRARELATLRALLKRAEAGEGSLVLLAGEAGAGKTRLVRELSHEAAARGVLVLYGASDAAVSTPYQPLREWLGFLLRVGDPTALGECLGDRGELARLVPELAIFTGAPALPAGEPESERYLLQRAATEFLRRLSHLQPVLLVADDVHWADSETLHLLVRLSRTAPEARLAVVAAYRDRGDDLRPEVSDTLADLARLEGSTRIPLGPLTPEEVNLFISGVAGVAAPTDLVAAVGDLTDGTPLFLCELWRELLESGAVEVSGAHLHLTRPLADIQGPERVRDFVRQRLARVDPETRALLELAAVAGSTFELRVLAEAVQLDHAAFLAAVEEAADSGMIEELPEQVPTCRFTHELVRRAVYDGIKRMRRADLHLRVGEALERLYADEVEHGLPELAHHFTRAAPIDGPERAVEYNLRAAVAAIASSAYDAAAAALSTALSLGIGDPRERTRIQIELAFVLKETGRLAESEAILATSLDAATGLEERGMAARALVERESDRLFADPQLAPAEVRPIAKDAIETFTQLGDAAGLAVAGRLLAQSLWREGGRTAESQAELDRALEHADASGDPATLRRVVTTLGGLLCDGPTAVPDAIRRCEQLLDAYGGDRVLEAVVARFLSLLLAMAGRFDEARDHVRRSSLVLEELNQLTLWVYRRVTGEAKELMGDRAGAEREYKAAWRSFHDASGAKLDGRAIGAACRLAFLYCDDGRWDDAADCLAYSREVPELPFFRPEDVLRLAVQARVAAQRGRLADAVTMAERAVERADGSEFLDLRASVFRALGEVQLLRGATADADAAVAAAIELYEAKGNVAAAARLRARSTASA
jgi:DNA-binding SARP family transcriptional activator